MEKKSIKVLQAPNLRQLVKNANESLISKDNIITIVTGKEGYYLIYYN